MLKKNVILFPLLAIVLTAALFLTSRSSFSFGVSPPPPTLAVDPQPLITLPAGKGASIKLTGRGLDGSLTGWIVPESSSRQAIIATLPIYNHLRELEISGRFAYLLTIQGGVVQVDLDNPRDPTVVNAITTSGQSLHLKVADNDTVLIAAGKAGLHLVELGAQRPARHLATIPEATPALDVELYDHTAFVARGDKGISIYDVSISSRPRLVGNMEFRGRALWLSAWEHYLAVALGKGDNGIAILDISVPSRPRQVSRISLDGESCAAFTINGHHALVATNGADVSGGGMLHIIDLSIPEAPQLTSSLPFTGRATDISWSDADRALLALGANGLSVIDMSQPKAPRHLTNYTISGSIFSAVSRANTAWLSVTDGELLALDLRQTGPAKSSGIIDDINPEFEPTIADGLMVVADKSCEIKIYDVAATDAPPTLLATRKMPGMIRYLMLSGRTLHVSGWTDKAGTGQGELITLDLSAPGNPRPLARALYPLPPWPVGCDGDRLVLLVPETISSTKSGAGFLEIIDISTPAAPRQLSTTPLTYFPVGALLDQERLSLMQGDGLFRVIDLRDPVQPTTLGEVKMPWLQESTWRCGTVRIIPWGDDLNLVSSPLAGIKVIHLADPDNPVLLGTIETDGAVFSMARDGDLLLVSRRGKGLLTISLERPWQPQVIGTWSMPGYAQQITVDQGKLWYALYNGRGIYYTQLPQSLPIKASRNGSNATIGLPPGLDDGDYSLWLNNDEGGLELPAQLRIVQQERKKDLG